MAERSMDWIIAMARDLGLEGWMLGGVVIEVLVVEDVVEAGNASGSDGPADGGDGESGSPLRERMWSSISTLFGISRAARISRNMWFWGRHNVPSTSKMMPFRAVAEWVLGYAGFRGANRRGRGA
jgi:hypothetical protein